MAVVLANGINYAWGTIAIRALGSIFVGVDKIMYREAQNMVNNYGAGNFPTGRGLGQVTYEGSIDLYAEELVALRAIAIAGRIQNIPEFDISVTYDVSGVKRVTDILKACRFMENSRDVTAGDTRIVAGIPLIIGYVEWGNSIT